MIEITTLAIAALIFFTVMILFFTYWFIKKVIWFALLIPRLIGWLIGLVCR